MRSIGMKVIHGYRESDNDGFTYVYGKHKNGYHGCRNKTYMRQLIRADKKRARRIDAKVFSNW